MYHAHEAPSAEVSIWRARVHQWRSSGKSAAAWCREAQIPYQHFIKWRRQLAIENKPDFIELPPTLELEEKSGLTFMFAGIQLAMKRDFDEETLLKCLRVMRRL